MTEERLAEWEQLFAEELEGKTPVWLLGWAVVAKRGGNDLLAEVRRLQRENEQLRKVSSGFMDIAGAALSQMRP